MDLSYPDDVLESLNQIAEALSGLDMVVPDSEGNRLPSARGSSPGAAEVFQAQSPLGVVAEYRIFGFYPLPLPQLLAKAGRSHVPLPNLTPQEGGIMALGMANAKRPWREGETAQAELVADDIVKGRLSVAPFFMPCTRFLFLVHKADMVVLVECGSSNAQVERVGDGFEIVLDNAPVRVVAEGQEATGLWQKAVEWERLALVGLTAGVVDRSYRIALDALWAGQQKHDELASEQVSQFQLADNYIDRLAVEHLVLDAAIDAQQGSLSPEKLALVRYSTSETVHRCAMRALHLASLFHESFLPTAQALVRRSHELSVFSAAREYEVQLAVAGLARGMSVE